MGDTWDSTVRVSSNGSFRKLFGARMRTSASLAISSARRRARSESHLGDEGVQQHDPKYCRVWNDPAVEGVLYPRAGTLGGCTAHNALIFVYPHCTDWDQIARLTGDSSWSSQAMRRHFGRLENCHRRPVHRWFSKMV